MKAADVESRAAPRELKKYELLCRLATGGMAELWLARSKGLGGFEKTLVIKRILPQHAKNGDFVKMFLDEARIAATLQHSNVVQVFDVDSVDGNVFMAMEFLHGQDLRAILEKLERRAARLPLEHAMTIVLSLCAGLHYAHEKVGPEGLPLEIVHRDVSPANVLVTYDGNVKLIDFGIARATGKLSDTQFGIIKGKLGYMSPEQCICEPLDRRSDVFCIGVILWELITGRPLYPTDDQHEAFRRTVELDAPAPSSMQRGIPSELDRIVLKALRRSRDQRYQTALELQRDLDKVVRERRLPISPFGLAQWMEERFGRELEAWKSAQLQGRSLAEFIATYRANPTGEVAVTGDYAAAAEPIRDDDKTKESPAAPVPESAAVIRDQPTPVAEAWVDDRTDDEERVPVRSLRRPALAAAGLVLFGLLLAVWAMEGPSDRALPPVPTISLPTATPTPTPSPGPSPSPSPTTPPAPEPEASPEEPVFVVEPEPAPERPKKKAARKKKVVEEDDLESVLPR